MKQVEVLAIGAQGDGVADDDDRTIHLSRVLPGELVDIANGKLVRVARTSPDRVEPFCQYYHRCGGCKFQHWKYDAYAEWKVQRLKQSLSRAGVETSITAMIDAHGAGRRRVTLHVRNIEGQWRAGFMEQKSHALVAIDRCPILVPVLEDAAKIAATFGPLLGACDVAVTAASNGLDVAVKAERSAVARRMPALVDIQQRFDLCRLSVNGDVVSARARPVVDVEGVAAHLPVNAFLQATEKGEFEIARLVASGVGKARNVADLFCGVGTFALRLAQKAKVFAVDSDKGAIDALGETIRHAQALKPVTTAVRNLFAAPMVPQELKEFEAVVLDPPRAGAAEQASKIARSNVDRVVYVSCDPDSFGRDAGILVQGGFKLATVTPVDQFKWSQHLEVVGVFSR